MNTDELLQRWSNGSITADELRELTKKLAEPEHQSALLDNWLMESSLPDRLSGGFVAAFPETVGTSHVLKAVEPSQMRKWGDWLSWRPLTAAATGIAFGMVCTSVVFGYSMPRMVERVLSIVNAGFEEPVAPLADGIPLRFGVWSGDFSEIVAEQQGIAPHEGQHMFKFLRSDSTDGFLSRAHHGNMYQFIDIRKWRDAISYGTAVVDWSAWFNCIREASGKPSKFEASMWAFAGEPSGVRRSWEERVHQELAYSNWRLEADDDPKTWQRVAGSLIVPPGTDFLVVELKAIAGDETPVNGAVTFAGHYADDVRMTLRTNAREQPQKVTQARP